MDYNFSCEKPVALDSVDHRFPHGTIKDSTHAPWFVEACERNYGASLKFLDLGCAGGGLVSDFIQKGHFAVGLEGSDVNLRTQRAEWAKIPDFLKTCDITEQFHFSSLDNQPLNFDIVTAWDVMEHIPPEKITCVLDNVYRHLSNNGIFVGTVSTRPSREAPDGSNYHATVMDKQQWNDVFRNNKLFQVLYSPFRQHEYVRGNGRNFPANFFKEPEKGFHFVLMRQIPDYLERYFTNTSWGDMSSSILQGKKSILIGRRDDLSEHLMELKREFSGRSELAYYVACLIVLVRRKIDVRENLQRFFGVWAAYGEQLCATNSLRWLVSSADTFLLHSPMAHERAAAANVSTMVGIVKLYETEIHDKKMKHQKIVSDENKFVELFDGVTSYHWASGDMLYNLISRLRALSSNTGAPGKILFECIQRLVKNETVLRRAIELSKIYKNYD